MTARAMRRAWRHARCRTFAWIAAACQHWQDRCDDPAGRPFGADEVTGALWLLRAVVAPVVPLRTRLAWQRLRTRTAWRARGAVVAGRDDGRWQSLYPADTSVLLSARLPTMDLISGLRRLRRAGQYPPAIFQRALARLGRTADGQVDPRAVWQVPSVWGLHDQHALGVELAEWAVTRAAWRRDPALRVLVTSARFAMEWRGTTRPVIHRLLSVALDLRDPVPMPERVLALVDAFTWPEFAAQGRESTSLVALVLSPDPADPQERETLGGPPAGGLAALRPHLGAHEAGLLLASPYPAVRAWVLTTVLPALAAPVVPGAPGVPVDALMPPVAAHGTLVATDVPAPRAVPAVCRPVTGPGR